MPGAQQPEIGVKSPYKARYGVTIGFCTGLDLEHDGATVADTSLTQAINVRVQDGVLRARFGQETVDGGDGMEGCIQGLIDVEGAGAQILIVNNGAGGFFGGYDLAGFDIYNQRLPYLRTGFPTVDGGGRIYRVTDKDTSHDQLRLSSGDLPVFGQQDWDDIVNAPRYVFTWWDGFPVYYTWENEDPVTFNVLGPRLFKVIVPEDGADVDTVAVEELFRLEDPITTDEFYPSSMVTLINTGEVNADAPPPLYFGTVDGGVFGYINGEMVELLPDFTMSGRVIVFIYNNRLFAASDQEIRFQDNGWVDGGSPAGTSWTTVTLPGAAFPAGVSDFKPNCAGEAFGAGWVGGWDDGYGGNDKGIILKLVETGPGSVTATVGIHDVTLRAFTDMRFGFGNKMWVGWVDEDTFTSGLGYFLGTGGIVFDPGFIPSDGTQGAYLVTPTQSQVFFFNNADSLEFFSYVPGRAGPKPFPAAPQGLFREVDVGSYDSTIHSGASSSQLYDGMLY